MPQLAATGLTVSFLDADENRFTVLDALDFLPLQGKLTVVAGASGSGKSTLLNALSGLIRPERGRVVFGETEVSGLSESRRDRWRRDNIGLVFQNFHLIDELGPRDNVLVAAWFDRWSSAPLRARADALLARLGVPGNRTTLRGLSRGERQRVAFARALMFDPSIVLADEPTASLDREAASTVIALLANLAHGEQKTVVVVSHDQDMAAAADAVVELKLGRLVPRQAAAA